MGIHRMEHRGSLIFGLLLIGLGIVFFAQQFLGGAFQLWLLPLMFLALALVFFAGMLSGGKEAGGFAIPGSIFMMLGLVFLFQNAFHHWESWAYAWALVAPTGVGIGLILYGWWSERIDLRRAGVIVTAIGLILFLAFGAFFELMFTAMGVLSPARFLLPLALVVAGVVLLFGRDLARRFGSWLIGGEWTSAGKPGAQEIVKRTTELPQAEVKQVESNNRGG